MKAFKHELKTLPEYFEAVFKGKKTFEIRINDRDFKVGDYIELHEHDLNKGYTGRKLRRKITYILTGGKYGLDSKYVCLGFHKPRFICRLLLIR